MSNAVLKGHVDPVMQAGDAIAMILIPSSSCLNASVHLGLRQICSGLVENYLQSFATKPIHLAFLRYAPVRNSLLEAAPNNFFGS